MKRIEVNKNELEEVKRKFEHLVEQRSEQNKKLSHLIENLSEAESSGFVEEIVEKLNDHITDVDENHISNLEYSVDYFKELIEEFENLDKNIIR